MSAQDLEEIKARLTKLTNHVERHIEIQEIHHNNMMTELVQHSKILYGTNGNPGLDKRVDRIETSARILSKVSWSGLMAGIGALGSFFLGLKK